MTLPWGRFRESTGAVPGLVGLIRWTFLGGEKNNQFEIVIKYAFKEAFPNRFPLENLRNPFRQLVPHRFPAFPSRNTVRNILKVEKFPQTKICQKSQIFVYNSGSNSGLLRPKNQFRGCSQKTLIKKSQIHLKG